jgi:hypothetical protein
MADLREVMVVTAFLAVAAGGSYYAGYSLGGGKAKSSPIASVLKAVAPSSLAKSVSAKSKTNSDQLKNQLLEQARDKTNPLRDLAIGKIVLNMDADTVQQVLAGLPTVKNDETRSLEQALIARWAHLDPEAALAYAQKLPPSFFFGRHTLTDVVLKAMGDKDPEGALETAARIYKKEREFWYSDGNETINSILDHLGGDGSGSFAWAQAHLNSKEYGSLARDVCAYLAKVDPRQAAALALQLPPSEDFNFGRRGAIDAVAGAWASTDPAGATAWAQTLGAGDRPMAYQSISQHWDSDDPKGAVQFYLDMPQWIQQRTWSGNVFMNWLHRDRQGAEAWLEQMPEGQGKNKAFEAYVQSLSMIDAKAAAELMLTRTSSGNLYSAIYQISQQLMEEDKTQAVDWLHKIPEGQNKQIATSNIYRQWANEDPKEALDYILANEKGELRQSALRSIGEQWGQSDPDGAMATAKSISDPKARNALIGSLIESYSNEDPKAAAALITNLPESERGQASSRVISEWAESDPRGAASWAATLPDGGGKNDAYSNLASSWISNDSTQATAWLSTLPQGVAKDNALRSATQRLTQDDPMAAVRLAASIGDSKMRDESVQNTVRQWMQTDATMAKAWVASSDLPQDAKDKLLK